MIARIGRASRLGERSRGYQDAGATSCALILNAMADAMIELAERNQKCRDEDIVVLRQFLIRELVYGASQLEPVK